MGEKREGFEYGSQGDRGVWGNLERENFWSPQGNRAGGPKLGDTLYGELSGLNPVSVFIEPIQVSPGTNRIIHGDLAKIRARIHRFQIWVEDEGWKEAELLQPPPQGHANRRALSYPFKNQPPICACKMPESFMLGLSGARSRAILK